MNPPNTADDPILTLSLPKSVWLQAFAVIGRLSYNEVASFIHAAAFQLDPQIAATDARAQPPVAPQAAPAQPQAPAATDAKPQSSGRVLQ